MYKYLAITIFITISATAFCQSDQLIEDLATFLVENGNESNTEQLFEQLTELLQTPLDINNSTEMTLHESGLFTSFQVFGMLKYREKYGPFFSIYELTAIPGFNSENLKNIAPLLTASYGLTAITYKRRKGMSLSNISLKLPNTSAFQSTDSVPSLYPGSSIKFAHRLKYKVGEHWTLGSTYEKDPGEDWILNWKPEHLTGYLQYKSEKFIRHVILGNFKIHRGLGLVHGLGFSSRSTGINLNGFRGAYAKPFASTSEVRYNRGVFIEAGNKNWRTDMFLSHVPIDISLSNISSNTDLFEKIRESGLHRTMNEINGSKLAHHQTGGISINRSFPGLNLGFCSTLSGLRLTSSGIDSILPASPNNDARTNFSIYGTGFGDNYEVYAETALDQDARYAILLGGQFEINPAISSTLSYRRYQLNFSSQTPNAFGSGGDPGNETGINVGFSIVPLPYARLYLNMDILKKLEDVSLDDLPVFLLYNSMRFTYAWKNGADLEFRITGKEHYEMVENNEPGNGSSELDKTMRFRIHLNNAFTENLKISSRIEISNHKAAQVISKGVIMYQQITGKFSENISLTYRILIFNSPDWNNRIYTYEPGVKYSFLFPTMYGKGNRNILVASLKIGKWGTLRGKIGTTQYAHSRTMGSGKNIRNGNMLLDAELQIQIDF